MNSETPDLGTAPLPGPPPHSTAAEIQRLSEDAEQFRRERDAYRNERNAAVNDLGERMNDRMKVVAAELSKELKDEFLTRLKNVLWLAGVLATVATLGGFLTVRSLITTAITDQVRTKLDARDKEIDRLRDKIYEAIAKQEIEVGRAKDSLSGSLTAFRSEADKALAEVRQNKEAAITVITQTRGDVLTMYTAAQSATRPAPDAAALARATWFGDLPPGTLAMAGAGPTEYAREGTFPDGTIHGLFSGNLLTALVDPASDANGDGQISAQELFAATVARLGRNPGQHAVMFGSDQTFPVGRVGAPAVRGHVKGRVLAVLVGINTYRQLPFRLAGSVPDAEGIARLLNDGRAFPPRTPDVTLLTDDRATAAAINAAIASAAERATGDDVVLFYFGGHVNLTRAGPGDPRAAKGMAPYDWEPSGDLMRVADVVAKLGKSKAQQRVIVVDG